MKYLAISLLCLLFNLHLQAQESFRIIFNGGAGTSFDEYPNSVTQLPDNSYEMVLNDYETAIDYQAQGMFHITKYGITDEYYIFLSYINDAGIYNVFYDGVKHNKLGIGNWSDSLGKNYIRYICITPSIIDPPVIKKYEVNLPHVDKMRSFIDNDNNLVICATLCPDVYPAPYERCFFKMNLKGDSILCRYETSYTEGGIYDMFQSGTIYKALATGYSSASEGQVLRYDKQFNLLGINPLPGGLSASTTAKLNPGGGYFAAGAYLNNAITDIGIVKLNDNDSLIGSRIVGAIDTVEVAATDNTLDFITTSSIFVGGTIVNISPNSTYPTWYGLYCFDSSLNLRWSKYYGLENNVINLHHVLATSDGGVLLTGNCMDVNVNPHYDVFMLKLDKYGVYTGIEDQSDIKVREVMLYPNPARDNLNIETALPAAEIALYGIYGNEIARKKLRKGITDIDITSLLPGIYAYRIISNNKLIESGKWVKQ